MESKIEVNLIETYDIIYQYRTKVEDSEEEERNLELINLRLSGHSPYPFMSKLFKKNGEWCMAYLDVSWDEVNELEKEIPGLFNYEMDSLYLYLIYSRRKNKKLVDITRAMNYESMVLKLLELNRFKFYKEANIFERYRTELIVQTNEINEIVIKCLQIYETEEKLTTEEKTILENYFHSLSDEVNEVLFKDMKNEIFEALNKD